MPLRNMLPVGITLRDEYETEVRIAFARLPSGHPGHGFGDLLLQPSSLGRNEVEIWIGTPERGPRAAQTIHGISPKDLGEKVSGVAGRVQ